MIIDVTVSPSTTIDVTVTPSTILDVITNPVAVKGDRGNDGESFSSTQFDIVSPQNIWVINHNKGYYPSVLVFDIFNKVVLAEIEHSSTNQVKIYFSALQIGKVIIN